MKIDPMAIKLCENTKIYKYATQGHIKFYIGTVKKNPKKNDLWICKIRLL